MAKKKKGLISDKIIRIAEILTAIGVIGGIGYSVGRWQSLIEHKTEIMEIRQQSPGLWYSTVPPQYGRFP